MELLARGTYLLKRTEKNHILMTVTSKSMLIFELYIIVQLNITKNFEKL